jgi:hypothetical protein
VLKIAFSRIPTNVPFGVAAFPNELFTHPESFMKQKFTNLTLYTSMPKGGHFAALEQPKLLADHLIKFVSILEKPRIVKATKN